MWVVSTSALLLGVPYALSIADEQQMVEMEKEQKMREMGSEVSPFGLVFLCLFDGSEEGRWGGDGL